MLLLAVFEVTMIILTLRFLYYIRAVFCRRGRRLHLAQTTKRAPLASNDMTRAACRYCSLYELAEERDCLYGLEGIQQACLGAFVSAIERLLETNDIGRTGLSPNQPQSPLVVE